MNSREKILGGILASVLGGFFVIRPLVNQMVGGIETLDRSRLTAESKLNTLQYERALALRSLEKLTEVRQQSLPSDPTVAGVQYQEYLVRALDACGIKSPMVSGANPVSVEGVGFTLQYSVQTTATAAQIGQFLDQFYANTMLHRLHFLSIYQAGGPDAIEHSLALGIEVLVLEGEDQDREPTIAARSVGGRTAVALSEHDIFRRPQPAASDIATVQEGWGSLLNSFTSLEVKPVEEPPPSPAPVETNPLPVVETPPVDPMESIRFVGVIENAQVKQALLFDSNSGQQLLMGVHGSLKQLGIEGSITEIARDVLHFQIGQRKQKLELGKRLVESTPTP